jgi:type I restriction enzyme S subunit
MKWVEKSLDELGTVSRGRSRHRPRDAAHLYGGPFPFIQTGDVKHAGLYLRKYDQTYSDAGLAQSRLWPVGTLCITIAANIADTAILGIDACFPDSVIGFIADEKQADARFVKYLFDALLKTRYRTFSQGVAQDNLSQEKLLSLKLTVPGEVKDQQRVADILSAYDNLIANNEQRIALLERSARLLFEEWFVRLRYPGHEHHKITDGVPDGWHKVSLNKLLVLQRGFDLPSGARQPGDVPVYASTGQNGTHNVAKVKGPGVVTGRSGSLGTVIYIPNDFWPLNTTLWVKELNGIGPLFAKHLLEQLPLAQFNGGAAVPTLNRNDVHRITVLSPEPVLAEKFEAFVADVYKQIALLARASERLSSARDLLLPRLMDGRIAV